MGKTKEGAIMPSQENGEQTLTENSGNARVQNLTKDIFLTFLKTFIILVGSAFYILAVSLCLSPNFAISVYDFLGATKASLSCYERIYAESGELADLYNLSIKCIEAKDYKKASKYIETLRGAEGYEDFCGEVNRATIETTSLKYIAYVADLDSYLVSQNILSLYESGEKQKSKELAVLDLASENVYSFGISTYAMCLMSDSSLSSEEKSESLKNLAEQSVTFDDETKTVLEWINERLALANPEYGEEGNNIDKILRTYTCLKIENLNLIIYENANEDALASETRAKIEELQNQYNMLIS